MKTMEPEIFQPDLFDTMYTSPDGEYILHMAHGFGFLRGSSQRVGVLIHGTVREVYYLVKDSNPDGVKTEKPIRPTIFSLDESCENCGYHRPNINTPFVRTSFGTNCTKLADKEHFATVTLPSDDKNNIKPGCICPSYVSYGTSEWQSVVFTKEPSNKIGLSGKNGFPYRGSRFSCIEIFTDYVVLSNPSQSDKYVISRQEYNSILDSLRSRK